MPIYPGAADLLERVADQFDEAGLFVSQVFGRWFAVWTNHHEPDLPEHQRTEVVRARAGNPGGDMLARTRPAGRRSPQGRALG